MKKRIIGGLAFMVVLYLVIFIASSEEVPGYEVVLFCRIGDFDPFGSAKMNEKLVAQFNEFVNDVQNLGVPVASLRLVIDAHTDEIGSVKVNEKVAKNRAESCSKEIARRLPEINIFRTREIPYEPDKKNVNARACSLTVFAPIGEAATLRGVKKSQDEIRYEVSSLKKSAKANSITLQRTKSGMDSVETLLKDMIPGLKTIYLFFGSMLLLLFILLSYLFWKRFRKYATRPERVQTLVVTDVEPGGRIIEELHMVTGEAVYIRDTGELLLYHFPIRDKVPEKDRNEVEKHIREDLKKYYKVINNFSIRGEPDPTQLFREKMVPKIQALFRRGIIVRAKALGEMK
ncbi:MAG: hypothetical protein HYY20_00030 [Candidatus Tectomicrobia bacterium]|uniref:Uncharacterized protein n=1 Tax=Tectimicrobiota bacterium TaxID=2528274 RepID=A0A932CL84_UNCTE|nr:hypothetical protein [Candidatus Tectomicrobia bacterium]